MLTCGSAVDVITVSKPKERQKRHARKYAEGGLGEDKSFYFRGPAAVLNLRAQNLSTFRLGPAAYPCSSYRQPEPLCCSAACCRHRTSGRRPNRLELG